MKLSAKHIVTAVATLFVCMGLSYGKTASQSPDSLVIKPVATIDSTLKGKSIFALMPSKAKGSAADVKIHQSSAIASAFSSHISRNASRKISGYRVRIYFDNQQNARGASEAAMARFSAGHPGVPVYRSYQNPFFKVTVGDFRTRSEALELLNRIKGEFPTAFILKENINYPPVDRRHTYDVDTVRTYSGKQ